MYHFLHICAIEIYLVEAHRQVEGRVGETENVPRDRAELAHLVNIEARIDFKDGLEDVVKDVTAVNQLPLAFKPGWPGNGPFGGNARRSR